MFANLVLADEINRATPKTQSALLEAMQERPVTGGETRALHAVPRAGDPEPHRAGGHLSAAGSAARPVPVEDPGGLPDADELVAIIERTTGAVAPQCSQVADAGQVLAMIELTRSVPVPSHVMRTPSTS